MLLYAIIILFIARRTVITTYNVMKYGFPKTPSICKNLQLYYCEEKEIIILNEIIRICINPIITWNIILFVIFLFNESRFEYLNIPRGHP
ncbi:hypothetical protein KA977_03060 [Candidatus Dependentiae bacterium]|nr:hypothetical protein [Candidatus Dependentiae bacterium]